jgi:hypothetical protein
MLTFRRPRTIVLPAMPSRLNVCSKFHSVSVDPLPPDRVLASNGGTPICSVPAFAWLSIA